MRRRCPGDRLFTFSAHHFYPSWNGLLLTSDDLTASYAIIRHNIRTYQSAGVLAVVRGKQRAESELKNFEDSQDSSDWHEGWRYFIEKTGLQAGTDPFEATRHRESELEKRESKALRETKTPIPFARS